MNLLTFSQLISRAADPVILIEGRRTIPETSALAASQLSAMLATRFPRLRFRSGNASGSDEAFSSGVLAVAPERLQIIGPYTTHRAKHRHPLASYDSPESLDPAALESIKDTSIAASPVKRTLINCHLRGGRTGAQAAYLIRDTMKVTGLPGRLDPPVAALFWIDPDDPEAGGTGHTVRVCRNAGVPTVFQDHWTTWLTETETHS